MEDRANLLSDGERLALQSMNLLFLGHDAVKLPLSQIANLIGACSFLYTFSVDIKQAMFASRPLML
jgi:hypothetical protein